MSDAPATLAANRQNQCHSRKIMSSPSGPQQRPYLPINSSSHNQQPQHLIVHHRAVNPEVSFSFQTSDGQSQQHINYQPNDQSSNAELMSMQQYNKRQTQYQDPYYQELELSNQRQQQQQQQEQKVSDGWNGSGQVEAQYHLQPSQHNRISSSDTLYQCSSASPFDYLGTVESSKSATHDIMSDFNNNDGQQNLTTNYSLGTQYILTEQQLSSDHKSAISSEVINYYSPLDSNNYDQQHYQSETATNYVNVQNNYCQSQQANGNNYDAHLNLHHHQHQQEQYHQESYNYLENTTLIEIQAQSAKPYKLHDDDLGFDDNILFTSTQEAGHSDEQAFQDTINSEVQQAQTTTSDKYSFTQVAIESHLDSVLSESDKTRTVLRGRRGRPRKKSLKSKKSDKVNGKLWEFIRDLLLNERTNPSFIRWERREDGVFKFVQSDKVAKMWGERKQNPKMTYEKLSRAMRYYYKSKVLLPVFGRRLVYKFGPNATGWLPEKAEV